MEKNPFAVIDNRLDGLEQCLLEIKQAILNGCASTPIPDIGGVEIATQETGLSSHSIYRLVSQRKIPHSKRLGRLYFSRKMLRQWIDEGQRTTVK